MLERGEQGYLPGHLGSGSLTSDLREQFAVRCETQSAMRIAPGRRTIPAT